MSISFPGIGFTLDYVAKSVRLFGVEISFYGMLIAMGMILAMAVMVLEAKRSQEDANHYLAAMFVALLLGTVGARLLYVAAYPSLYQEDPRSILALRNGGLSFYGGLFGGYVGLRLVAAVTRSKAGKMLDICTPSLLLAQAVGRVGDFFNRASFGEYTTWITRMRLPLEAVSAGDVTNLMRENLETVGDKSYILAHPTFLYESLWCLLLLAFLVARKHKKLFDGEIFLKYLVGYGLGRAVIEYLRTDQMPVPYLSFFLPLNLIISVVLAVFALLILLVRRSMAKKRRAYRRARREAAYEKRRQWEKEEEEEDEEDVFALLQDLEEERRREMESISGETPVKSVMDEVTEAASIISPRQKEPSLPGDLTSFDMEEVDREVEEVFYQRKEEKASSYREDFSEAEASSKASKGAEASFEQEKEDVSVASLLQEEALEEDESALMNSEESAKEALELLSQMEAETASSESVSSESASPEDEGDGEESSQALEAEEDSEEEESQEDSSDDQEEPLDDEDGFLSE